VSCLDSPQAEVTHIGSERLAYWDPYLGDRTVAVLFWIVAFGLFLGALTEMTLKFFGGDRYTRLRR